MRKLIAAAVVAFAVVCQSAFAVETFDQAWAKRWRPQVTGSLLSRRFEPEIKASAKEVWDVAQANVAPAPAGPLVAANKATVRVAAKAKAKTRSKSTAFTFSRRRWFHRR